MDSEGRSSSGTGQRTSFASPASRRPTAYYKFTQQNLPACKPVLTPGWVFTAFLLIGVLFIPVGFVCLRASESVVEIVERYDTECIPELYRSNKVAYIKDDSLSKNCTRILKVQKHMKAPIYIYYQLDNFYQNHRRYVKSKNDRQLLYGLKYNDTSSCQPEEHKNGLPIVPCGLIAWSLFNDTFTFFRDGIELRVNRKNIAWKSDREHKFGKHVYPFNFQNGSLIGGKMLDPDIPLSEQEDLIVWMRTSALPSFRKLYGRIEEDLEADDYIAVNLANNYNTYSFGGKKKVVLSTSTWLGGKNNFLGVAYIAVGSLCIVVAFVFVLLHMKNPRYSSDHPSTVEDHGMSTLVDNLESQLSMQHYDCLTSIFMPLLATGRGELNDKENEPENHPKSWLFTGLVIYILLVMLTWLFKVTRRKKQDFCCM